MDFEFACDGDCRCFLVRQEKQVMQIDDKYLGYPVEEVRPDTFELMPAIIEEMLLMCWQDRRTTSRPNRPPVKLAVGLAANQVGVNARVIVVDYAGFKGGMINPVITKFRGGTCRAQEGCLSFKKKFTHPLRHKIIVVEYLDIDGNKQRGKYRGLMARIIQHEVDHLDGITMFDREKIGAAK